MLAEFTAWLVQLVSQFFADLWQFVVDAGIELLDLIVTAIVGVVSLVPVPSFMSAGLQSFFVNLDPSILYFVTQLRVPEVLAMIGAAYLFRLARLVLTLFQWS